MAVAEPRPAGGGRKNMSVSKRKEYDRVSRSRGEARAQDPQERSAHRSYSLSSDFPNLKHTTVFLVHYFDVIIMHFFRIHSIYILCISCSVSDVTSQSILVQICERAVNKHSFVISLWLFFIHYLSHLILSIILSDLT